MEERNICWSEKNGDGKGGEYLEKENNYLCRGKGKGGKYLQRRKTEKQKGGNNAGLILTLIKRLSILKKLKKHTITHNMRISQKIFLCPKFDILYQL